MRVPQFVIVGAQKAATTYLQVSLSSQPGIYMPPGETPLFEDPDYQGSIATQLSGEFRGSAGQIFGIKRPSYLCKPEVPARIAEHLPQASIIAVLREPVSRAVAAHNHLMAHGILPIADTNELICRLLDGKAASKAEQSVLEFGRYGTGLSRYYDLFPREQVFVTTQEAVRHEPSIVMERLLSALNYQGEVRTVPRRPINTGVYSPFQLKIYNWLNARRYAHDPVYGRIHPRHRAFDAFDSATAVALRLLSAFKSPQRQTLDKETAQRLRAYYAEEVALAAELTGLNLSAWR